MEYMTTAVSSQSFSTVQTAGDEIIKGTSPTQIIRNTLKQDTDGGRIGKIIFEGFQSGGEKTVLGTIEVSHDGSSDDEKGKMTINLNDGNDGSSPTNFLSLFSSGILLFGSGASSTDYPRAKTIISKGDTGDTSADEIAIVGEAPATSSYKGVGARFAAKTSAAHGCSAVQGVGRVNNTSDNSSSVAFEGIALDTHAGASNIAYYANAENSVINNYSFYGNKGDIYNEEKAYIKGVTRIGEDAISDFINAQMIVSQADSGNTDSNNIGIAAEGVAVGGTRNGYGGLFTGKTDGANAGSGIVSKAKVTATGDTGVARGIVGISIDTHAGANNIAIQGDARNGAANYCFYGLFGQLWQTESIIVGTLEGDTVGPCVGNTIRGANLTSGTTANVAGADLTIQPGLGTGTGDPGILIFNTVNAAASGTGPHTVSANTLRLDTGTALVGPTAVLSEYPGTRLISSHSDTGDTSSNINIGIVGEAAADGAGVTSIGGRFVGKSHTADNGIGIMGIGRVNNTTDTGDARGGSYISTMTHAGGRNIGASFKALNGDKNYAIYCNGGSLWLENDFIIGTLEADDVGPCVGNTIRAASMVGGTTSNVDGADITIESGKGTGIGDPGTIIFNTTNTTITGSTIHTASTNTMVLDSGKVRIGSDAVGSDYSAARMIVSEADSGSTNAGKIGIAVESIAGVGKDSYGVLSHTKTYLAQDISAVYGKAIVNHTDDTGGAVAFQAISIDTHAGGNNVGYYAYVTGSSKNNYAFIASAGDLKLADGKIIMGDRIFQQDGIDNSLGITQTDEDEHSFVDIYNETMSTYDNKLRLYALGNVDNTTDLERLTIGWDKTLTNYIIKAEQDNAGVVRNIVMSSDDTNTQMVLNTDGTIDMQNKLTLVAGDLDLTAGDVVLATGKGIKVNGNTVVTDQGATVADPTDLASCIARVSDIIDRLQAHGLIAT